MFASCYMTWTFFPVEYRYFVFHDQVYKLQTWKWHQQQLVRLLSNDYLIDFCATCHCAICTRELWVQTWHVQVIQEMFCSDLRINYKVVQQCVGKWLKENPFRVFVNWDSESTLLMLAHAFHLLPLSYTHTHTHTDDYLKLHQTLLDISLIH